MDNKEDILDALNEFEKKPTTDTEIPQILEQYLQHVAKTGKTLFPWLKLKKLFVTKVDTVMEQFKESSPAELLQMETVPNVEPVRYEDMRKRILSLMDEFQGAPFTIQRLCELLLEPKKHYKRCDKFLRGIEKNVSVVTTVDPFGRKIVSEFQAMVNGLDSNGFNEMNMSKPNPFTSFPTPTQSAWTANIDKWFGTSDQAKATSSTENSENPSSSAGGEAENDDENLTEQFLEDTEEGECSDDVASCEKDVKSSDEISSVPDQSDTEKLKQSEEQEKISQSDSSEEPSCSTDNVQTETVEKSQTESTEISSTESTQEPEHQITTSDTAQEDRTETPTDESQTEGESKTEKSDQAFDLFKNAQNILDSVNKTCSDAEETVCLAQKALETDQEGKSCENEVNIEQSKEEPSSALQEQSQPQSSVEQSDSVPSQSQNESESKIKEKAESTLVEADNVQSSCIENVTSTNISHESLANDGSGDSASEAKKPRLSDTCESMDVDSNEFSDSSNNSVSETPVSSTVMEKDSEEQARLESIAEVGSSEDTPMEQD